LIIGPQRVNETYKIINKLNIFNLKNTIRNNRTHWTHHVGRIEPLHTPRQIINYIPNVITKKVLLSKQQTKYPEGRSFTG
jgi:hypothetical protein